MKLLKKHRFFASVLNMTVMLFLASACNYGNSAAIDDGLTKFVDLLEVQNIKDSYQIIESANNIKKEHKKIFAVLGKGSLVGKFDNTNTAKAKEWIRNNDAVISNSLEEINKSVQSNIAEINRLSKDAYLTQDKSSVSWRYATTYFKLQYLRNDLRQSLETLAPLALIIHSNALADDKETLAFRKNLETKLLSLVGVGIVLDQDYNQVKSIIANLNQSNQLPQELKEVLSSTDTSVIEERNDHNKSLNLVNETTVAAGHEESHADALHRNADIKAQFEKITFLYTPGQKYFVITKLLTVVGNLTWGLVNTAMGAAVVVAAMAVSPFTPYVDFPTFAIAKSGMQIYADVSGMSPIAGKMSLGLFELDNHSGVHFASHHEGGHAIQSALLGPFYVPVVLLTYVVSGFDSGLMENLADSAAYASDKWL